MKRVDRKNEKKGKRGRKDEPRARIRGKGEEPLTLDYDYLDRVRRVATLTTKRKTTDLLEGDFRSLQHGRSLEFDDLREYRFGDEVSDIDWKSSSRTGKTLIRRNVAERRHDVMIVGDTGLKMTGDTPAGESKAHLALMTFGVTAYLLGKQGANYALAYHTEHGDVVSPFLTGPAHLEELIYGYRAAIKESAKQRPDAKAAQGRAEAWNRSSKGERTGRRQKKNGRRDKGGDAPETLERSVGSDSETRSSDLTDLLAHTVANIPKRMVIIVITDMDGLAQLDERLIRLLVFRNDVYVVNIRDAYLTSEDAFDLTVSLYEDSYITGSRELRRAEEAYRMRVRERTKKLFARYRVSSETISREEEIVDRVALMFRQRREME